MSVCMSEISEMFGGNMIFLAPIKNDKAETSCQHFHQNGA